MRRSGVVWSESDGRIEWECEFVNVKERWTNTNPTNCVNKGWLIKSGSRPHRAAPSAPCAAPAFGLADRPSAAATAQPNPNFQPNTHKIQQQMITTFTSSDRIRVRASERAFIHYSASAPAPSITSSRDETIRENDHEILGGWLVLLLVRSTY